MLGTATTRETLSGVHDVFEQAVNEVRKTLANRAIADFTSVNVAAGEPTLPHLAH